MTRCEARLKGADTLRRYRPTQRIRHPIDEFALLGAIDLLGTIGREEVTALRMASRKKPSHGKLDRTPFRKSIAPCLWVLVAT